MEGYLDQIWARIARIEAAVFPQPEPAADAPPAQTMDPRRMPAQPGLPIAPFDSSVHYEEGTQEAIDAENAAKANPSPMQPMTTRDGDVADTSAYDETDDPTLNADGTTRKRRKSAD